MRGGKVVVIGPGEAGKSTLIGRLVPDAMNLAVRGRTVAMDHAVLARNGCVLSLVGVPGQDRFLGVQEALLTGALGAIWVHPAGTEPAAGTFELVRRLTAGGTPYAVVVNRRRGELAPEVWRTPDALPEPRFVFDGDLADTALELEGLEEQIWALVTASP